MYLKLSFRTGPFSLICFYVRHRTLKNDKFVIFYRYTLIYLITFYSVEDVSSLAEAISLIEVTLDGNPVALGGDCTPFLVSYLPNLITLTSMNVTEQVSVLRLITPVVD